MSTIPAWARKGAEVVCIKDIRKFVRIDDRGYRDMPAVDAVYKIAWVRCVEWCGRTAIGLVGFPKNHGFDLSAFKPVTKRTAEQDIAEHFADLLKVDAPEHVSA